MLNVGKGVEEWEEEGKRKWKRQRETKTEERSEVHGERMVITEYLYFSNNHFKSSL